ncbi:MAG: hypothetical protein GWP17_04990 [Aquificales bacterium]|nr:hypothetical protein [Aquificales bacterium]
MSDFSSVSAYQSFLYSLPERYPSIQQSSLAYIPTGKRFGRVEGMLFFMPDLVLCIQEFLNFELGVIEVYGYEVSRTRKSFNDPSFPTTSDYCKASYPQKDKLYWYDSFPHPHIPELASTDPHHKHIPPDIKHNRIPAPDLSFTRPNLPFLIAEIESLLVAL